MTERARWIGLAIFIFVCLGAGALGAIATTPEIEGWYKSLEKPSWNPPSYIFGPVWTTLYIMMAVAAWLVWRTDGFKGAPGSLILFAIQIVLNIAWSWMFFGMHQTGWAFAEIVVLWLMILATRRCIFQIVEACRFPVVTLPGLGQFCRRIKFHPVAIERRLASAFIRSCQPFDFARRKTIAYCLPAFIFPTKLKTQSGHKKKPFVFFQPSGEKCNGEIRAKVYSQSHSVFWFCLEILRDTGFPA